MLWDGHENGSSKLGIIPLLKELLVWALKLIKKGAATLLVLEPV